VKLVTRSLKCLNHTADLVGRSATGVLLEESDEGLKCVGLLGRLVVSRGDNGGLGLSRCSRRRCRSSFGLGRLVRRILRLDALGVVGIPVVAFEA
jgi:hypothetical protein